VKPEPAKAGRATCTFESKKGMILICVIDVSCRGEGRKKIKKICFSPEGTCGID